MLGVGLAIGLDEPESRQTIDSAFDAGRCGPESPRTVSAESRPGNNGCMNDSFPPLKLDPGNYPVEWTWGDDAFAGELELEKDRMPKLRIFGEPSERERRNVRGFPDPVPMDRIEGRLRMGMDVVAHDTQLETWFPRQTTGFARFALVGMGIRDVEGQRYSRVRLQITGLDMLLERPPLAQVRMPADAISWEGKEFAVTTTAGSSLEWTGDGMTVHCSYASQMSGTDPYRFALVFAPVIDLEYVEPLGVDEWLQHWVVPLYHLLSFATKKAQAISWVTLTHEQSPEDHQSRRSAQLFGGGIHQEPYLASRPEIFDDDQRPVFTFLGLLDRSLPDLIRKWASLLQDKNPFLELFRSVLFSPDLPARARYLYLIQALETLHATENAAAESEAQEAFETRRAELLAKMKEVLEPKDMKFLKSGWSKRRPESLTRRLEELIGQLEPKVQERLSDLATSELGETLKGDGADSPTDMLRVIRNELSHGTSAFEERALRPWVELLEEIARKHLARLLGIPSALGN